MATSYAYERTEPLTEDYLMRPSIPVSAFVELAAGVDARLRFGPESAELILKWREYGEQCGALLVVPYDDFKPAERVRNFAFPNVPRVPLRGADAKL